jgi:hypothetical protein
MPFRAVYCGPATWSVRPGKAPGLSPEGQDQGDPWVGHGGLPGLVRYGVMTLMRYPGSGRAAQCKAVCGS